MLLNFKQGIIQADSGFIVAGGDFVSLIVADNPVSFTACSGSKSYTYTEQETVVDAWGPIYPSIHQWLYWDINTLTAERTFGITLHDPIVSGTAPLAPSIDQHWFDSGSNTMKVWSGSAWITRIRVFACKLSNGVIPQSVSINAPAFDGTQVGIASNDAIYASGDILFDEVTGMPLRIGTNSFATTEDALTTTTLTSDSVRITTSIVPAQTTANLGPSTVVEFTDYNKVSPATQFTSSLGRVFGLVVEGSMMASTVNVVTAGPITNNLWDFTVPGAGIESTPPFVRFPTGLPVNTQLYSSSTGELTSIEQPGGVPVAMIIGKSTILMGAPQVKIVGANNRIATSTTYGTVQLNIPPAVPGTAIVVGDNDPRLQNVDDIAAKVDRIGDTMTGFLTLHADPTSAMHAATKQYVDAQTSSGKLNDISAADGTNTIANANFAQVWNWQLTGSTTAFQFGETAASTGAGNKLFQILGAAGSTADLFNVTSDVNSLINVTGDGEISITSAPDKNVYVRSGSGTTAGDVIVQGGNSSTAASAGHIQIVAGAGDSSPGDVDIVGGNVTGTGKGGDVTISSGTSLQGEGGDIHVLGASGAGTGAVNGGAIELVGGQGNATGIGGGVLIASGAGLTSGALTFRTGLTDRLAINANGSWTISASTGTAGQVLTSAGASATPTWQTLPAGVTTLDGLTDVIVTTPSNGQVLKYNGTNWINDTDATGGAAVSAPIGEILFGTGAGVTSDPMFNLDLTFRGLTFNPGYNNAASNDVTIIAAGRNNGTGAELILEGGPAFNGTAGGVFVHGGRITGASGTGGNITLTCADGIGATNVGGSIILNVGGSFDAIATAGSLQLNFGPEADLRIDTLPGTAGQVLTSNGPGVAPTWTTPAGGGGSAAAVLLEGYCPALAGGFANTGGYGVQTYVIQNNTATFESCGIKAGSISPSWFVNRGGTTYPAAFSMTDLAAGEGLFLIRISIYFDEHTLPAGSYLQWSSGPQANFGGTGGSPTVYPLVTPPGSNTSYVNLTMVESWTSFTDATFQFSIYSPGIANFAAYQALFPFVDGDLEFTMIVTKLAPSNAL